jgi:hypothetical protein
MTAPDAPLHYDVTREALIEALRNLPLTAYLNLEARGKFADALLGQMPAVSEAGSGLYRAVNDAIAAAVAAEREGIARLAEDRGAVWIRHVPCGCDDPGCTALAAMHEPFADLIREQP